MEDADFVWGGLLLVGAAVEVWALHTARSGDTLSESTRRLFRVNTRTGRWVFAAAWCGFATWFLLHVLDV